MAEPMADDAATAVPMLSSLTSLRWIAASLVFAEHATALVHWGWYDRLARQGGSAVSFFFVLSGFVLSWTHRPGDGARQFYRRRFARIYPAYAVAALVAIPLQIAVRIFTHTNEVLLALFTLTMMQAWVPSARSAQAGTGSAWTLSHEAFFYLNFPWIIRVFRRMRSSHLVAVIVTLVLLAYAVPMAFSVPPHEMSDLRDWVVGLDPATRIFEFAIGVAAGLLVRRGHRIAIGLAPIVALTVAAYLAAGWFPTSSTWLPVAWMPLLPLVPYLLLIVRSAQSDLDGTTAAWFSSPMLQRLGAWSYCFYLIHQPLLRSTAGAANRLHLGDVARSVAALACYVGVIGLSGLLHRGVEVPAARWLRARDDRLTASA